MRDTNDTVLENAPGVLMAGLSRSKSQCQRKHIISNPIFYKYVPYFKIYILVSGKWQGFCGLDLFKSLHMWVYGGGRCLATVHDRLCTAQTEIFIILPLHRM